MTKSMTEGNPLRLILQFALPLLAGNLLQQMYNVVDGAIVGQTLGAEALGSVGATSSVQFLVLGFCIGICTGFAIPIAQKFGAKDYPTMRRYIYNSAILTGFFAVVITAGCVLLCHVILHLLDTPAAMYENAYRYLVVIFLGIPFTLLYNLLSSILRAVGDSKTPFIFLAISATLNIFGDFFCILVLHLGCAGAAIATIAAQGISGILCYILIAKKFEILHIRKEERQWNRGIAGKLFVMGIPMGLQYSITAIGSMVMQTANNGLGTLYVSAFAAGLKIKQFTMCPFDALATAVSMFAGQNLGAEKPDRIKKGIHLGIIAGVLYGLLAGVALIFAGRYMTMVFVSAKFTHVIAASAKYCFCMGFFYWTLGILNVCRMSTQGIGFSGRAVFSGVVEMLARSLMSIFTVPVFGFTAICFTDQAAWITASIYSALICHYSLKAVTKKIEEQREVCYNR